jgi:hypothetical protein
MELIREEWFHGPISRKDAEALLKNVRVIFSQEENSLHLKCISESGANVMITLVIVNGLHI